jgi:hypothetical protein
MRVLVACEYSGMVREAFAARGWEAWSCDLLESERPSLFHYQGDVRDLLTEEWDLLVGHPPCTYLTNSANRHLYRADGSRDPERWENMREGAEFFNLLWNADVPHIALENPVMTGAARDLVGGKATQYIQPWQFGTPETKQTGLRLKNLPPLVPTSNLYAEMKALPKSISHRVHYLSPGPDRWKERSRTFPGVAQAMADQWGAHLEALVPA